VRSLRGWFAACERPVGWRERLGDIIEPEHRAKHLPVAFGADDVLDAVAAWLRRG